MPKKEKGKSHSTRPVSKRPPSWCRYQPEEVEAFVIRLAKEGNSLSKIGTILRDQYAIPLVKPLKQREWRLQCQKIWEIWLRRHSDLRFTWIKTRRTFIISVLCRLSKLEFTNSPDTIKERVFCQRTGSIRQE